MESFSERMGIVQRKSIMQRDGIDNDLRTALLNVYYTDYFPVLGPSGQFDLAKEMYVKLLNKPVDEIPTNIDKVALMIRSLFINAEWNLVYDLIQFLVNSRTGQDRRVKIVYFIHKCNEALETHMSYYRFINYIICPISSDDEIQAIQEATNSFSTVNKHLTDALKKLSDRENPDYRNSIKESISAVECLCKIITNDDNASLGKALDLIKNKGHINIHPALNDSFNKLYGYTSNEKGIRHSFGLLDEDNLNFEEAKFMLVSCSAFINFLNVKASKAVINIT
jgi:hypothetical protein